jgi:hypothetical protein
VAALQGKIERQVIFSSGEPAGFQERGDTDGQRGVEFGGTHRGVTDMPANAAAMQTEYMALSRQAPQQTPFDRGTVRAGPARLHEKYRLDSGL